MFTLIRLLIEIRNATHQGQPVIVILVSPMPADELLEISEERNNRERRLILVRDRGEVGQVRDLQGRKEIRALEDRREQALRDPLYQQLWQRFLLSSGSVACSPPDKDIEPRVAAYCREVQAHLAKWYDLFTPLEAEEDLKAGDREIFEPEAVESLDYFASDDPWDEEMADDPEDDEEGEEGEDLDGLETPELDESPLRIPRRASVFELLKQEPRAVLLGEPGGGKTTCLQRLTLEAAGAYQRAPSGPKPGRVFQRSNQPHRAFQQHPAPAPRASGAQNPGVLQMPWNARTRHSALPASL